MQTGTKTPEKEEFIQKRPGHGKKRYKRIKKSQVNNIIRVTVICQNIIQENKNSNAIEGINKVWK